MSNEQPKSRNQDLNEVIHLLDVIYGDAASVLTPEQKKALREAMPAYRGSCVALLNSELEIVRQLEDNGAEIERLEAKNQQLNIRLGRVFNAQRSWIDSFVHLHNQLVQPEVTDAG